MSDNAPDTQRLPDPAPIVRLHPAELARRLAIADRLIAEDEARERAERNRWREASDEGR